VSEDFDSYNNEFIRLDGGKAFIRKFEVVGLFWKEFRSFEDDGSSTPSWRLEVFFNDAPHMSLYGEDARAMMRAFDLPEDPPK
jgi:hypothetical protein